MARPDIPSVIVIPDITAADRADRVLVEAVSGALSRSYAARLIRQGKVLLHGQPIRPSTILKPGDRIEIVLPTESAGRHHDLEAPGFQILFEDDDVVVVEKPPGLVVHPGSGRPSGTLMDALIKTRPEMIGVGQPDRWGIVHRLDRDTSGVMVVAKTNLAYAELSARFKEHSLHRVYLALVRGDPCMDEGIIDIPLGRHLRDRKRISTATAKPREALTRWKVVERYGGLTLLEVTPATGRTHQIRVHLAWAGLPVASDPVYGRRREKSALKHPHLRRAEAMLKRQALHAAVLGFRHPRIGEYLEFSAPPPADMAGAIEICRGSGTKS